MNNMSATDSLITIRILKLLTTPFEKMEAFKLGIIDKDGKKIKDPVSDKEKEAYNILHRLVIRLKRVINKIPVGNKQFLSYAAAYALIKESINNNKEPADIEDTLIEAILQGNKYHVYVDDSLDFKSLWEDGMGVGAIATSANTTQNIKDTITGVGKKAKLRYFRRSKIKNG